MRRILLLFLLPVQSLFAQAHYMPYELERQYVPFYSNYFDSRDEEFTSELEALEYYFLAYKIQRAENPAAYFPAPNSKRDLAANYLNENFPGGDALALIDFLEYSGNRDACEALLSAKSGYKILLPYQFIAAELMHNRAAASKAIQKMDTEKMLSPTLKDFGKNAVASFGQKTIILTQGIQDLIAIAFTLDPNSKIHLRNLFLEQCAAFAETQHLPSVNESPGSYWISPTIDIKKLDGNQIYDSQGIGFAIGTDSQTLSELILKIGLNFAGTNDPSQTPADRGLVSAYRYFSEIFTKYSNQYGSKNDEKAARHIARFVKAEGKQ